MYVRSALDRATVFN